jgi:hypothetical protein
VDLGYSSGRVVDAVAAGESEIGHIVFVFGDVLRVCHTFLNSDGCDFRISPVEDTLHIQLIELGRRTYLLVGMSKAYKIAVRYHGRDYDHLRD